MPRFPRCRYKNKECYICRDNGDGTVRLVTDDYTFVSANGGWERVDKFEWEKTVPKDEVMILPDADEA